EADALARAIAGSLAGLGDPAHGTPTIRSVLTRAQVYRGAYAAESPDLVVNFADGYRVSWGTALGAVPAGPFADKVEKWSGDHLMGPSLVPGGLFLNRPFPSARAGLPA